MIPVALIHPAVPAGPGRAMARLPCKCSRSRWADMDMEVSTGGRWRARCRRCGHRSYPPVGTLTRLRLPM